MPARTSPIQLCLLSFFFVDRFACSSTPLLRRNGGIRNSRIQFSRTLYNSAYILFNKRSEDGMVNNKHKRLQPGKVSPRFDVPDHIMKPPYVNSRHFPQIASRPEIHDIKGWNSSGHLEGLQQKYWNILEHLFRLYCIMKTEMHFYYQRGTTSDDIDKEVHQMIIENGAHPSPLGYSGFPKSVCTSVNECICHGIPDSRPLERLNMPTRAIMAILLLHSFVAMLMRMQGSSLRVPVVLNDGLSGNREWGRMQLGQTFTPCRGAMEEFNLKDSNLLRLQE
ncbi:hypothetical protein ZIOFF_063727 [Zingiber officinale]|uniref:Peptidase M24 domain-containing protein n=1 Tax=Zingiber officinale TaxID=94328 RepID=A0A8J5F1Y7_ZINOF|nr:hypothetical protein ZIOFF_063727 [Zingiber officinale]